MISVFDSQSGYGHKLELKEDDVVVEDATFFGCRNQLEALLYMFAFLVIWRLCCPNDYYLHKSCAELSIDLDYQPHTH